MQFWFLTLVWKWEIKEAKKLVNIYDVSKNYRHQLKLYIKFKLIKIYLKIWIIIYNYNIIFIITIICD